ncbi:MAG: DedA family protein [Thermoplasmata archaeon]|jgi:membrane protein DedA with SNARE-associated domain
MSITEIAIALIIDFLAKYGYAAIFFLMLLESMMLPIPSEVVIPFGGYLAYKGVLNIYGVILSATLGGLAGSYLAFLIGYYGGRHFIIKYGKYMLIDRENMERAERWFSRYGSISVFTTRLVPVIRTFISLPAGIARMDTYRFLLYTFLGSLIWSIFLGVFGYLLKERWTIIFTAFSRLDPVIVGIGIAILGYIIYKLYKNYKKDLGIQ